MDILKLMDILKPFSLFNLLNKMHFEKASSISFVACSHFYFKSDLKVWSVTVSHVLDLNWVAQWWET